ncbi:MAG: acyltransferase family protein [Lysobacterales bacterium]
MSAPVERLHALDAVRAGALLLGLWLHASMSFFLPLPVADASPSPALALSFYVIHVFRMSLFFTLAGYFARPLLQRRGLRAFLKDRGRRIGLPLAVGWLLLVPLTLALLVLGNPAAPPPPPAAPVGIPLMHLWFLYYLLLCYGLMLALRAGWQGAGARLRTLIDRWLDRPGLVYTLPLLMALPAATVLAGDPHWLPWFGIPAPDHGLLPQAPALLAYFSAFAVGWLLHRQPAWRAALTRAWALHLPAAVTLTVLALWQVGPWPATEPSAPAWGAPIYALCYLLAGACWVLGLIGAALRFAGRPNARVRALAEASYWIYLTHLPLVFALQLILAPWPLSWMLKFPLILLLTLVLTLASYQLWIRDGLIGRVLNGRRDEVPIAAWPAQAPVAELIGARKAYAGRLALDGLDLAVQPGQLLALLGPNGAGKSTAIGLWLGTLQADAGAVRLFGGAPADVHSRLGVGVMLQDVHLAPTLTAREHIALTSSYYREPLDVARTLALAGIEAIADRRYGQLSGGQQRQVQYALALCGRPRLLFLDEPSVGMDTAARESLWRSLRGMLAEGCAIVLTTHYLEEAEALADRVVVLAQGRVLADGSVDAVRARVRRTQIECESVLAVDELQQWPGVLAVRRHADRLQIECSDADALIPRLYQADPTLKQLSIHSAGLAEALQQLTKEAA